MSTFFFYFQDINVCILENYPECSNPRVFYIIPYFCGQHPQCRYLTHKSHDKTFWCNTRKAALLLFFALLSLIHFPSLSTREPGVWALERAKQNVLENYLLVGVLEELEDVLLLLERLLPHYFTGVLNIYKSPGRYYLCSRCSLQRSKFGKCLFFSLKMVYVAVWFFDRIPIEPTSSCSFCRL